MSTIRVDNFGPSAGGTTYSARGIAKAWVNFNGTGTIAARDSENLSSLTDNGTGDYTVNFTNGLTNANYGFMTGQQYTTGTGATDIGPIQAQGTTAQSTTSLRVAQKAGGGLYDANIVCISAHGDLA